MKKIYSPDKPLGLLLALDTQKAQKNPKYVSALEHALLQDPDNFQLRCKLVGAYAVDGTPELVEHLLWFTERYAHKRFISSSEFYIPDTLESQKLVDLWEKKILEHPTYVDVLVNFVYVINDKKRKAEVLAILQKLYPKHDRVKVLSKFLEDTAYPPQALSNAENERN